jgi:type VI secretion system protein ImpG
MSRRAQEELLDLYQAELSYLRRSGAAFAEMYPKVAGRLELGGDECPDPHVERLIEAFAFLTARIQHNLNEEFPEITSSLLDVLYPHYLCPVPSTTVARMEVDPAQGKLTSGHLVPRHTPLFAQTRDGLHCRFRTCYPVTLWPVEVAYAGFESTDRYDFLEGMPQVATVLRIRVESLGGSLRELDLRRLRFYLDGEMRTATALYELLFAHATRVAILPEGAERPVLLPQPSLLPVGLGADEEVLPYPPHSHPGYRLLQEYFTAPRKFLFFDADHLDAHRSERHFDLLVLLDRLPPDRLAVDRHNFVLGCTPVVNLFRRTTEPIRLHHRTTEYRLVPDVRRERTTEVHSIQRVSATSDRADETQTIEPFYSFSHAARGRGPRAFWTARRRPSGRKDVPGTEMWLSFLDLDFRPAEPDTQTVYAHTLCTNRRLAEQLPDGALLQIEESAPLHRIVALHAPTRQLDPALGGAAQWRLISHLSLNHLSLESGRDGLRALREILRLYAAFGQPSIHEQIMGIREMECRRVVRRVGADAWRGFCRGTEVTLTFDEESFAGTSAFLLATVLNHFFGLYASVNSFTQTVARSRQREGTWKRWEPRAGEQTVL